MKKQLKYFSIALICNLSVIFCNSQTQWAPIVQSTDFQFFMTSEYHGYDLKQVYDSGQHGYDWWMYRTDNDWQTYTLIGSEAAGLGCCNIEQLFFLNDSVGFKVRHQQSAFMYSKTIDFGNNWALPPITPGFFFKNMFFLNDTLGYIAGTDYYNGDTLHLKRFSGSILSTDLLTYRIYPNSGIKVYFKSDSAGFILYKDTNGVNQLLRTDDYGNIWTNVLSDNTNQFTGIDFSSDSVGYLTCTNGILYKSPDGGITWNQILSPTTLNLNGVDFINDTAGLIVGNNGGIYQTVDGGMTWLTQNSGTTDNIIDIKVFPNNKAYASTSTGLLKNSWVMNVSGQNLPQDKVRIYPNPTTESVYITNIIPGSKIVLLNLTGQIIKTNIAENSSMKMNLENVAAGIYFIEMENAGEKIVQKLIVE